MRDDTGITSNTGITPIAYRILIEPDRVEEKTSGGLFLPEDVKDKDGHAQRRGRIIAMGSEAFEDMPLTDRPWVGDVVFYNRYAGANAKIEGTDGLEYVLIKDGDILAVIKDGKE